MVLWHSTAIVIFTASAWAGTLYSEADNYTFKITVPSAGANESSQSIGAYFSLADDPNYWPRVGICEGNDLEELSLTAHDYALEDCYDLCENRTECAGIVLRAGGCFLQSKMCSAPDLHLSGGSGFSLAKGLSTYICGALAISRFSRPDEVWWSFVSSKFEQNCSFLVVILCSISCKI